MVSKAHLRTMRKWSLTFQPDAIRDDKLRGEKKKNKKKLKKGIKWSEYGRSSLKLLRWIENNWRLDVLVIQVSLWIPSCGCRLYEWRKVEICDQILEQAMEPHSSTLAWKIPWMEEPGRLQSMGSVRVRHDWATSLPLFTFMHCRRKWQPLQCSCLENPRDRGA